MEVVLDIKDLKVPFIMELLQSFSFVKAKALTAHKAKVLEDVKEAVEEMKLVKAGKLKARNAEELLHDYEVKIIFKLKKETKRLVIKR